MHDNECLTIVYVSLDIALTMDMARTFLDEHEQCIYHRGWSLLDAMHRMESLRDLFSIW